MVISTSPHSVIEQALNLFFLQHGGHEVFKHAPVLALSGGLDSTVLLHALVLRGLEFTAVHVNHQLQQEAAQWPAHCQALCAAHGVPFHALTVQVNDNGLGLEAHARQARYRALFEWMLHAGSHAVLCAHHLDDQLETVLIQMLRGSGLRGLGGMRAFGPVGVDRHVYPNFRLCRPLLNCSKRDLHAYAKHHALHYINDPSNTDTTLRRNWIRLELLPQLRTHFPQADGGLLRLAEHFQTYHSEIDSTLNALLPRVCDATHALNLSDWRELPEHQRLEALKAWLAQQGIRPGQCKLLELQRQLLHANQGGVRQVAKGWRVKVQQGKATAEVLSS